eukprot:gene3540-6275_t
MEESEDEFEEMNPMILSTVFHKGRLGVAHFNSSTGTLSWGETYENESYNSLEFVKFQFKPNFIITSYKSEKSFVDSLRNPVIGSEEEVNFKTLKATNFNFENAKKLLSQVNQTLQKKNKEQIFDNDFLWGLSSIDISENHQMVRATGGILTFIKENSTYFGQISSDDQCFDCIKKIVHIPFEGFLQLDLNTIESLSIFKRIFVFIEFTNLVDKHPASTMSIGVAKEGLSLFGIMDKTVSKIGKSLLRDWFLQPILDLTIIETRLDTIEFFQDSQFEEIIKELRKNIKEVKDIGRIAKRIQEGTATVNDWSNFEKTLSAYNEIVELCDDMKKKDYESKISILYKLPSNDAVTHVLKAISSIIDFRESKSMNRISIFPGIDDELDKAKQTYDGLGEFLTVIAEKERSLQNDDFSHDLSVVFFPQLGYLVAIQKSEFHENSSEYFVPGLTFHFMSDEIVYFKSETTTDLDQNLGDIHGFIVDKENSILHKLEQFVINYSTEVLSIAKIIAELDCLLSFTLCSLEYNYTRPKMTKENRLSIVNGRNPLQEMVVSTFIPNDTNVTSNSRLNIITGPNCSGKSVYLKQVALIVYLAHLGSFVPCDKALIGLTDRIFTRIHSKDSISVHQSTFAIDLIQMNTMIESSTSKSLLLIDEFGKGTLAIDGIALLSSTLQYFAKKKEEIPKIFCTTHFTEILEHKLIDIDNPLIQFHTMEVLVEKDIVNSKDVIFLYKLGKGKIIPSYGVICAEIAGIPKEVLARSDYISHQTKNNFTIEKIESEKEKDQMIIREEVLEKFKSLDCDSDDKVKEFFQFLEVVCKK